jgi:2-keto-4-pentenoate hydratase/2-oxohepta-3-ene-1,7-dioic acid hydratase in catechol pathway
MRKPRGPKVEKTRASMKDLMRNMALSTTLLAGVDAAAANKTFVGLGALVTSSPSGQILDVSRHTSVEVEGRALPPLKSFKELLAAKQGLDANAASETFPIGDLKLPLPETSPRSLGIGLSYPDHQNDVKLQSTVYFEKNAKPTRLADPVPFRENLDYETEVSLLLHRSEPHLFGYMLHNDLTDRRIQVFEFNKKNPAPGFAKSKSFPRANAHGVLMAVGNESLWKSLSAKLFVNGELRQSLATANNVLSPTQIHRTIFSDPKLSGSADWVLVGTGTPSGTVFVAPSKWAQFLLYVRSGFNMTRAREAWLKKFQFLAPGDKLEFRSEVLGHFSTRVEAIDSSRD